MVFCSQRLPLVTPMANSERQRLSTPRLYLLPPISSHSPQSPALLPADPPNTTTRSQLIVRYIPVVRLHACLRHVPLVIATSRNPGPTAPHRLKHTHTRPHISHERAHIRHEHLQRSFTLHKAPRPSPCLLELGRCAESSSRLHERSNAAPQRLVVSRDVRWLPRARRLRQKSLHLLEQLRVRGS